MCVIVLYGRPQRSGELLHATALPARITGARVMLDEPLLTRPSSCLGDLVAVAVKGSTAARREAVEKSIVALFFQAYSMEMSGDLREQQERVRSGFP